MIVVVGALMPNREKPPDSPKSLLAKGPPEGANLPHVPPRYEALFRAAQRPSLKLERLDGHAHVWKLAVAAVEEHPAPQRLTLDVPRGRRAGERANVTNAFRPEGVVASYAPRLAAAPRQSLFRASGKPIRARSEHVFGDDDRNVLSDYSYPWWCIGSVGDGSGALVGPRLVLTAAHSIDPRAKYSTVFTPGRGNGGASSALPSARVDAWLVGAADGRVCANDFAIGVLSQPLGLSLGWLGTRSFSEAWRHLPHFMHVGLRGGVLPSWQGGISIEDVDHGPSETMELETFCDSESGQSGGPLFAWWQGKPYIVGVMSGYQEEFTYSFPWSFSTSHNVFAGGPGMVARVARMRAEYD
jgi:hypothetical protein